MTILVYSTPNGKEEGESLLGINQEYCQRYDKETAELVIREELKNYTWIALVDMDADLSETHWEQLAMFPDRDLANIYAVGNAAGDGARIALLNRDKRGEAEEIARKIEYMELAIEEDFQTEFIEALQIPHMRDPFPHVKNIIPEDILLQ